jgi:hypothetical protein
VIEWRPPTFEPAFIGFWLLAAALLALSCLARPWRAAGATTTVTVWAALAMLPLALLSGRNVPSFGLLAVPAVATLLEARFPSRRIASSRPERPLVNMIVLATAGSAVVVLVAYCWTVGAARLRWHPLSQPAMTAIASCPEKLYNRYDEGGYVIWFVRNRKVFIDSRQDPYPPELVLDQIRAESSGDYEGLFERYGIRCAFIPKESLIAQRLATSGWKALYEDSDWVVLASSAN